jgi:RHH-type proline utilization regulon transcriptional repressor/proline dehydrogenase/delta 1-pyrroline-5-carboxylate dehydrogenase
VKDRLRTLYRQAWRHHYRHPDSHVTPKFVNLDMEEYRDLDVTVTALREVLDEDEFLPLPAGVVLQAYLPDSHRVQRDLTDWALERATRGGAPIKLRIVKGANLAMERIEGELHGWPQAPYATKPEVDANYVRMLEHGSRRDRARAVHLGIASHNLFDVAYGLLLREDEGVEPWVEFEMLEGMANHQARAVQARAGGLLLYAPVVRAEDFASAIAYLVRRARREHRRGQLSPARVRPRAGLAGLGARARPVPGRARPRRSRVGCAAADAESRGRVARGGSAGGRAGGAIHQ